MTTTAEIYQCDVCGHRWLPQRENPVQCPSRACRSARWNASANSKATPTHKLRSRTTEAPERNTGHTMKDVVALLLTSEQITDLRAKAKKNDAIGEYARLRLKDAGL